jgi:hypothetical protein
MKKSISKSRLDFLRTNKILVDKTGKNKKAKNSIKKIKRKGISAKTISNLSEKNPLKKKLDLYLGNESSGKSTTVIDRRTSARKGAINRGARELTESQIKAISFKK